MASVSNVRLVRDTTASRVLVAKWEWNKANTASFTVRWWYATAAGLAEYTDSSVPAGVRSNSYTIPDNAIKVTVQILAVSTTHTVNNQEVSYWTATWSSDVSYTAVANLPSKPSVPTVAVKDADEESSKLNSQLITASLENISEDTPRMQFVLYIIHPFSDEPEETQEEAFERSKIGVAVENRHAEVQWSVVSGYSYAVRARGVSDLPDGSWYFGEWSDYSSIVSTKPGMITEVYDPIALTSTSVKLSWQVTGYAWNADSYDIEYTTDKDYFDSSDGTTTITGIKTSPYTKTGLESGRTYYFRVRAVNSGGNGKWSDVFSCNIGSKPEAPTTWSEKSTVTPEESIRVYWVHNSEDNSVQTKAEIEVNTNKGTNTYPYTSGDEEAADIIHTMTFDKSYVATIGDGGMFGYRVRTAGVTGEFGEWSVRRYIHVYATPSLSLAITDSTVTTPIETVTTLPLNIKGLVTPDTQTLVSINTKIVSNADYEISDDVGVTRSIRKGAEIYNKSINVTKTSRGSFNLAITTKDIQLQNNVSYTATCIVALNSGLTATASATFNVAWKDNTYNIDAEIGVNRDDYTAYIRPTATSSSGDAVWLGVHRREYDGSFTTIAENILSGTYVTDPHPALDYARYRITAKSVNTGFVEFYDAPAYPVHGIDVIIQWDEAWTTFDSGGGRLLSATPWNGSMIRIPYNIDVSETSNIDVSMIEYVGRKHPVSYYGTQLGISGSWRIDIPSTDKEMLYAFRRLSIWTGDVYVREPSGLGYWANVKVSMSQTHCELITPITLDITRVEGGT